MSTFANTIDSNPIYADRAENDKDGNRIDTTYAKLADIPSVPVTDVTVNGTSVVSSGTAAVTVPTATSDLQNDSSFITLSDVPAQQQADWTESDTSDPSYIANKPNLAAVATSGSYLDLSNKPTINNVPAVTSSDDDKVLKASYTGGVGSYSWETAGSGGTYTAGDGIAIDQNNEVSVRIKNDYDNALKFTQEQGGGGYANLMHPELAPNYEDWQALADNGYIHSEYDDVTGTTNIEFRYRWDRVDGNPLGMVCTSGDNTRQFAAECHLLYISSKESYTTFLATSRLEADYFTPVRDAFDSVWVYCLGSLVDTTDDGYVFQVNFSVPGDQYSLFNAIAFSVHGQDFSNISDTVQSSFLGEQHVLALQGSNIYIVGDTVPGGDLYVQVDQIYDPVSALPQSGFAVDEAIGHVRQVPYSDISDEGKVLKVDANGDPAWATGGGGGGGTQADWTEADSSDPSYIQNKPTPKTLTAGTGISISEGVSTLTISSNVTAPVQDVTVDGTSVVSNGVAAITSPTVDQTYDGTSTNAQSGVAVADAIGNLPTNLTSAQILALKEALGIDETVLWEDNGTPATISNLVLSESVNNFERVRITFSSDLPGGSSGEKNIQDVERPTANGDWFSVNFSGGIASNLFHIYEGIFAFTTDGTKLTYHSIYHCWGHGSGSYEQSTSSIKCLKVVGVNRIASN